MSGTVQVGSHALVDAVARIFLAVGVPSTAAATVASDLVSSELEGVPSHGVMLVPMYVERLRAGSIAKRTLGNVISDRQSAVVIDAGNALGQLVARQAVDIASAKAGEFGMAGVAVRNAFHFGAAGLYARMLADRGCVGIVMCNTRPLMPPTGGAEPVTGNNPLAVVVPGGGSFAPEVDMALSAAAMGKIRNAAASGKSIPIGWATDSDGADTTDPQAAISGMLLPAAGPKGFGLAFLIDLLCGGLSGGGIGGEVRPLFGLLDQPYNSANLFIAIDVAHFECLSRFSERAKAATDKISSVRRAPGVERIFAPGELAAATREKSGGKCILPHATVASLCKTGVSLNVNLSDVFPEQATPVAAIQ